jgi:hypothetical protein
MDAHEPPPPRFEEPESVILPPLRGDLTEGIEVRMSNSLAIDERENAMSILFDRKGSANCLIYKTPAEDFLILNGMRFRILCSNRKSDDRPIFDNDALYYEMPLRTRIENQPTVATVYPGLRLADSVKFIAPPECERYLQWRSKTERKKESCGAQLTEALEMSQSMGLGRKSKSRKRERQLSERDLEDSDSDD